MAAAMGVFYEIFYDFLELCTQTQIPAGNIIIIQRRIKLRRQHHSLMYRDHHLAYHLPPWLPPWLPPQLLPP